MADTMITNLPAVSPGKLQGKPAAAAAHPTQTPEIHDLYVVVLAGGEGRRLQGFVRQFLGTERPKQFCRIMGSRSMLRHTWDRAERLVPSGHIVTVITAGQERFLEAEASSGVPGTVLVQPQNKETGAGLLLPLLWIARRAPAATVVVFPADHFIWEEDRFAAHVRAAILAAHEQPHRLALLGVEPTGPERGYGWIAPGEAIPAGPGIELYTVRRFWEKPDHQVAARLFARGDLWNTFVMAGRLPAYLSLAGACIPRELEPLRGAASFLDTPTAPEALRKAYAQIAPRNFSEAVLARCPAALMVVAARGVAWSDWGEPHNIVTTLRRFNRLTPWLPDYAAAHQGPMASPAP